MEILQTIKKNVKYMLATGQLSPGYPSIISRGNEGNNVVMQALGIKKPMMISRLGAVELACISYFLLQRKKRKPYPAAICHSMRNNAGYFPVNNESLDRFSEFFLEHVKNVDIMGVWFNDYEDLVICDFCPTASLVELECLEPFHFKNPWSLKLEGKNILVIHPFVDSIQKQYHEKRSLLFDNPNILPDFNLKIIKAVQSIANTNSNFNTWFEAFNYMCCQIDDMDFDIAIIGAGAYGLPLSSYIRNLGKQAIHLGGVTQILFGIKGKRWETEYADSTAKLFNEHWLRPTSTETPKNYDDVEGGCYW